jgi:hypothetical protein
VAYIDSSDLWVFRFIATITAIKSLATSNPNHDSHQLIVICGQPSTISYIQPSSVSSHQRRLKVENMPKPSPHLMSGSARHATPQLGEASARACGTALSLLILLTKCEQTPSYKLVRTLSTSKMV